MNGMTDQDHRTCGINDMNCLGGEEKEQTLNDMNGVSRGGRDELPVSTI